jgi:hypothetical protein
MVTACARSRGAPRPAWGTWWDWRDNQLVAFLVLFLFYSAYFMLRFSVEAGPRRASMSAVYALFGTFLARFPAGDIAAAAERALGAAITCYGLAGDALVADPWDRAETRGVVR